MVLARYFSERKCGVRVGSPGAFVSEKKGEKKKLEERRGVTALRGNFFFLSYRI